MCNFRLIHDVLSCTLTHMHRKIRRNLQISIVEGWTIVWTDDAQPARLDPDSHLIEWDDDEDAPEVIVLRRRANGLGWQVVVGESS